MMISWFARTWSPGFTVMRKMVPMSGDVTLCAVISRFYQSTARTDEPGVRHGRKTGRMLAVALWFLSGVVAARIVPASRGWARFLNLWVINVALPALILAKLPGVRPGSGTFVPVSMAWLSVATGIACVAVLSRRFGWSPGTTGAMLLVVPLGNTSFLGFPVIEAILGHDAVANALPYDQLGSFLLLATWGSFVAGRFGTGARGWRPMARRLATFTPFIALLVSIPLRTWPLPDGMADLLLHVGRTVAPVALVSLGLRFRVTRSTRHRAVIAWGLVVKMAVLPLVVLAVAAVAGDLSLMEWKVSVMEAAMPPMVTAGVVGIAAGLDEELLSTFVGTGTILGLVVMSVVSLLV